MAKARRDNGVGALPDDLVLDVFARVPEHVDLLRCAGVCRQWLRLIADPAFLRRAGILPEDAPDTTFVAGAFYQDARLFAREKTWIYSEWPPKFKRLYPWPGGDWPLRFHVPNSNGLFDYNRWSFKPFVWAHAGWPLRFFLPNHDGLFNYARPLASRRGLLLLRVLPIPIDWRNLHLVVCDPLSGRHRLVTPLTSICNPNLDGRDVTGYAILTDADDQDRQQRSALKVLFTAINSDDHLVYAYSYSSATDGWSAPTKCSQVSGLTMSGPRAGVVARGIVYWLYRDETNFYALGVSADATDVNLTKIPTQEVDHHTLRLQPPFPCVVGGKLSFAIVDRRTMGMLDLWTKHDPAEGAQGGPAQWTHSNMMSKGAEGIKIFAFAERRGALLVHDSHDLFTLDLDSKKMEKMEPIVCTAKKSTYGLGESTWDEKQVRSKNYSDKCDGYLSCTICTYNSRVLYEMDWPSYILHLSAGMLGAGRR